MAWADESEYYKMVTVMTSNSPTPSRPETRRPGDDLALEVSGLTPLSDGRLAVATRKGDVWFLNDIYDDPPKNVTYHRFARALHEPLGLVQHGDSLYVAQRSELTRLRDTDGDDVADEYLTVGKGWGVTGNYHEYAYGPKLDRDGNFWITLNIGIGDRLNSDDRWRGWGVKITPAGDLVPVCSGMRSPCGLGSNLAGDMFFTDQQGEWIGTCSLHHMQRGVFFGNPEGLSSANLPGSMLKGIGEIPSGHTWPQALKQIPQLRPPAIWLPYKKMGQSATDVLCDTTGGKFGPFAGQLFVGEFSLATINRVFLEQVDGRYQGACFPFRQGFASAVVRMTFGRDGSMFVGLTNRGWSSIGTAASGLQRLVWTGKTPFEIKEMRACHDGFELVFTKPVDAATAADPRSFAISSYTYLLHKKYGSDEVLRKTLAIIKSSVSEDGLRARLSVQGLREGFVHELQCPGVQSCDGEKLLHDDAYYTLNRIPRH